MNAEVDGKIGNIFSKLIRGPIERKDEIATIFLCIAMRARGSILIFIVFYAILDFIVYAILVFIEYAIPTGKGTLFELMLSGYRM